MVVLNLRRLEALAEVLWQARYNDPELPAEPVREVAGVIDELAREAREPLEALVERQNLAALERKQPKGAPLPGELRTVACALG